MANVNFNHQLIRQLRFLKNSCRLYDEGGIEEAIRIATCLRVLFHTTKASTSLLTHLNAESCCLLSTAKCIPGTRDALALVVVRFEARIGEPLRALPKLDASEHRRFIPFSEWWGQEAIVNSGGINSGRATRQKIVLWAANKDGGAHVDQQLEPDYQAMIDGLGMVLRLVAVDERPIPETEKWAECLQDLHFASLRQIAYEVLMSPEIAALHQ